MAPTPIGLTSDDIEAGPADVITDSYQRSNSGCVVLRGRGSTGCLAAVPD